MAGTVRHGGGCGGGGGGCGGGRWGLFARVTDSSHTVTKCVSHASEERDLCGIPIVMPRNANFSLVESCNTEFFNFSPTLKIQCENCLKPKLISKKWLNVGFRTESDFAAAASDARQPLQPAASSAAAVLLKRTACLCMNHSIYFRLPEYVSSHGLLRFNHRRRFCAPISFVSAC